MNNKQIVISEKILSQNPLFWPGQGPIFIKNKQPNIFLGTGISTPNALSQEIPFDTLGFLLSAEFIRQRLPNSHVFLLIADQHAQLANNMDKPLSLRIADHQENVFKTIVSTLCFSHWQLLRASMLFPESLESSYEKLEQRDITHFFHNHKTGIKVGWTFSMKEKRHKTDEVHFDQNIDIDVTSIFIKPGITLDPLKPLESPYICTNPSGRILLIRNEKVLEKLNNSTCSDGQRRAVQNQLKRITMLFEHVIGPLPHKTPVEEKVQIILDKIFI